MWPLDSDIHFFQTVAVVGQNESPVHIPETTGPEKIRGLERISKTFKFVDLKVHR
jgi:hypothetical protein